jgi:hypothetical protein
MPMDMKQIMEMANQLRSQLADAQAEAGAQRYVGEAGGGLVRVVLNGRHEAVEVKIDPAAVDPDDLTLLEDLLRAAFNQASGQLSAGLKERLGSVAQTFGVDLSGIDMGGGGSESE